jgi:NAD+ kinase
MKNIHFIAANHEEAQAALAELIKRYGQAPFDKAEVIIPLGGDGTLLDTLHNKASYELPVYGMNKGSVGFLMNSYNPDDLIKRLEAAETIDIRPLRMRAITCEGETIERVAFNEVALFRSSRQAAKIAIYVDDELRMEELVADGVMLASPAGSTAYNFSAHGPIMPLTANLLALTPISPFRPRRWRGALLPQHHEIRLEVHDPINRPVSANADSIEVKNIKEITIWQSRSIERRLMFDPDQNLDERILNEQFMV